MYTKKVRPVKFLYYSNLSLALIRATTLHEQDRGVLQYMGHDIQKTIVVIFNKSTNQSTPFFKNLIGEDTIKYSSNYKYLGIALSEMAPTR